MPDTQLVKKNSIKPHTGHMLIFFVLPDYKRKIIVKLYSIKYDLRFFLNDTSVEIIIIYISRFYQKCLQIF